MINRKEKRRRKPETIKAVERMIDLADAFSEALPEQQAEALNALDAEFKGERSRTSRNWHRLFTDTFRFAAGKRNGKIRPKQPGRFRVLKK